jgi:hypothetical protein
MGKKEEKKLIGSEDFLPFFGFYRYWLKLDIVLDGNGF